MKTKATTALLAIAALALFSLMPFPRARAASIMERPPGEKAFARHCSRCHGEGAAGTDKGPPLVHRVYHPNHHADESFRMAVRYGVRAHHWRFGNMPQVKDVTPEETEAIIEYVRRLQKEAGIY